MKTLVQYIYENKDANYSEYLKKRAEIDDKYDHENGPEQNKINDKAWEDELNELDKQYPTEAKRYHTEQCPSCSKGNYSKERKVATRNVTKQELPAEYLKELAELEDKYDHEFGSFEKNQQMDNEYNEKLAQLKKKYNIK